MNPSKRNAIITVVLAISFYLVSFTTSDKSPFGTFTDERDQHVYRTVKIGKQTWMAENLNYVIEPGWCFQCDSNGRMYTYESALKACPKGWHVPTVKEWKELIDFLGGEKVAGGKMKRIEKWLAPNKVGDNSSNFCAIPVSERGTDGTIRSPIDATWWTADKGPEPAAWTFSITASSTEIKEMAFYKVSGFAVRCVKD